jgi:hypothetical protein
MHFTASTSDFGKALGLARSCAPQKSTVPILSHFLVRTDERGLAITASDLDREVTIRCAAVFADCGMGKTPMQLVWGAVLAVWTEKRGDGRCHHLHGAGKRHRQLAEKGRHMRCDVQ